MRSIGHQQHHTPQHLRRTWISIFRTRMRLPEQYSIHLDFHRVPSNWANPTLQSRLLFQTTPPPFLPLSSNFSSTPPVLKKTKTPASSSSFTSSSNASSTPSNDPLDLSPFRQTLHSILTQLKTHLTHLHSTSGLSGRFNIDLINSLRVILPPPREVYSGKPSKQKEKRPTSSIRLSEIAQLLPRSGRLLNVVVSDKEYVKPVLSAIQGSPWSLNPQPVAAAAGAAATAEDGVGGGQWEFTVLLPPPSMEGRKETVKEVVRRGEEALGKVEHERARWRRLRLNKGKGTKGVSWDETRRVEKEMESEVQRVKGEIRTVMEALRRALERR